MKDACWREHLLGKTIDTSSAAWLTEHGAKKVDEPFADLGICYEARVGPSFEEAVICTHRFGTNAGVELGSTKIVTVRNHRPLLLLEALDYMSEMSVAPSGPDEPTGPLFALTADVSNLGKEVRFSLPKPTACTEATAHVEQEDPSAAGASPEARKLLAKNRKEAQKYLRLICANATTFTWSNGVYKK